MSERAPGVAIIMATYNHAPFVGEAIESVLAQTYPDWELIVVDDGSTDPTVEIARRYRDPRIRVVTLAHRGLTSLAETYRTAVELSSAPLIAILDGDDRWPPGKLARQVKDFEDPDVVLSYGAGSLIDQHGCEYAVVDPSFPPAARTNRPTGLILPSLLANNAILAATVVLRRSALEAIGGFWQPAGVSYVDHPTWLLLAMQGAFAYQPISVGSWRRHPAQWTTKTVQAGTSGVPEGAYVPIVAEQLARKRQGARAAVPGLDALIRQHADRAVLNRWRVALLYGDGADIGRALRELVGTRRPRLVGLALLGLGLWGVGSDLEWMQARRNRVVWPSRRHLRQHRDGQRPAAEGVAPTRKRLRLAYHVHGVGDRRTGVRRLILDQAVAWSAADPDVEVGVFVRCEAGAEDAWRDEPGVVAVASSPFGILGRFVAREVLSMRLALWQPDVIYLRHTTVSPSLIFLAALFPTIVGGDLDDLNELKVRSRFRYWWRYWWARFARNLLLRRARRIMVVTREIGRHASLSSLECPVDVFPNTINVAEYPELRAPTNASPRLVFLGSPRLAWAGVDKIERLARYMPTWQFDLIGPGRDEFVDPPPNLVLHGQLDRDAYLPIMAGADVAIGPLALHRKALSEQSALKVAEYLAYGIPVIISATETAFPDGAPFLLQVPNTEDNVDQSLDKIRDFVEAWIGRRVERAAITSIDSRVVEAERLHFLLEALRENRPSVHVGSAPSRLEAASLQAIGLVGVKVPPRFDEPPVR